MPERGNAGMAAAMCRYVMETDAPADEDEAIRRWELISSAIHGKQWVRVWADHKRWQAAQAAAIKAARPSPSGAHESVAGES